MSAAVQPAPGQLRHDGGCGVWSRPAKCTCGEWKRDPELWRTVSPKPYLALLEAAKERRPYTNYVAMLPERAAKAAGAAL